jgi:hypothetical protein
MHQKPLLQIYQTNQPKKYKDKKKDYGNKRKNRSSEAMGIDKDKERTCTTKSDKERKFQNNRDALSGVHQDEIDQHKADRASCWRCDRNCYYMLECFMKKTSKGTGLATAIAAITKKGKCQRTEYESDEEEEQNSEPVTKWPKKVATITQTLWENSLETQSWVCEIETSKEELN